MSLIHEKENFWGLPGKVAHMDAIVTACEQLAADGKNITRGDVRLLSGVSNNNYLHAGIKIYKEFVILRDECTHCSAVLLKQFAIGIESAVKQKIGSMESQREKIIQQCDDVVNEAKTQASGLTAELGKATADAEHWKAKCASLRDQHATAAADRMSLTRKIANLELDLEICNKRISDYSSQFDVIKETYNVDIAYLRQRHGKQLEYNFAKSEKHAQILEKLIDDLKQTSKELSCQLKGCESELFRAKLDKKNSETALANITEELKALDSERQKLKAENIEQRTKLTEQGKQLAIKDQQLTIKEEQITSLQARISELEADVLALRTSKADREEIKQRTQLTEQGKQLAIKDQQITSLQARISELEADVLALRQSKADREEIKTLLKQLIEIRLKPRNKKPM